MGFHTTRFHKRSTRDHKYRSLYWPHAVGWKLDWKPSNQKPRFSSLSSSFSERGIKKEQGFRYLRRESLKYYHGDCSLLFVYIKAFEGDIQGTTAQ